MHRSVDNVSQVPEHLRNDLQMDLPMRFNFADCPGAEPVSITKGYK